MSPPTAVAVGSVFTFASTASAVGFDTTAFSTYGYEYRIVSWGVIIRSQMTASTAKGSLIVSSISSSMLGQTRNSASLNGNECQVHSLAAGTEVTWYSRPSSATAHNLKPISSLTNTQTDLDWTSLCISIVGSDTTANMAYVSLDIVMNVEFTVIPGDSIAQLAKQAPPANPVATQIQSKVMNTTSSFISAAGDKASGVITGWVNSALDDVYKGGLSLLGFL